MEITYKEKSIVIVTEEECKGINLDRFKTVGDIIPLIVIKDELNKNLQTLHLLLTKKFVISSVQEVKMDNY